MKRTPHFICVIALLICHLLHAQGDPYSFIRLDIAQGLSHNQVNCFFKDEKGFIWFGTMSGLNRYDGYKVKVFKNDLRDPHSINDNYVSEIAQGPDSKIWVSTYGGWNIYDPVTEKFTHETQKYMLSIGIADTNFVDIQKDRGGCFWFLTRTGGLYKYDPSAKRSIHLFHRNGDPSSLHSDSIAAAGCTSSNAIWIVYTDGFMECIDGVTHKTIYGTGDLRKSFPGQLDYRIFTDGQDDLWIYAHNDSKGVVYYNTRDHKALLLRTGGGAITLNSNIVYDISQDNKGTIWIGTDHGGINLVDKRTLTVNYLLNNPDNDKSIGQNSIYSIYNDKNGIMWVGTFKKGISYFHEAIKKFPLYKHQPSNRNSLPYDDVNNFVEDSKGNLWIGTNGGGLIFFDRANNTFKRYVNDPSNPYSLSNDVIVGMCMDHEQKLWIGTYYGGLNCFDGKKFIRYKHSDTDTTSIGDDRIWEIMEDSQQRLWIGTFAHGLDLFDRHKNTFSHYRPGVPNSVLTGYISSLLEDRNGKIWIGTGYGIDVLDTKTGKFAYFLHNDNDNGSLSNNNVNSLMQDSRGWIWAATRNGLNCYRPDKKRFTVFRIESGLPDNMIVKVLEDNNGNIWVSTPNALSNIIISAGTGGEVAYQFKNYDQSDGLQRGEFNDKSGMRTRDGELLFGGANGFNLFYPENKKIGLPAPPIVLTDLQVFNRTVGIGEEYNKRVILPRSISELHELTLKYNQNVFSIEFAALNFYNPEKTVYAYKMESFNRDWLLTDSKNRRATFTNLDPGEYVFRVKAVNKEASWKEQELALKVVILPPFWKTPFAYAIYFLIIAGILALSRHMIIRRARLRFALEQERKESMRLHELDMMKIRFFTNVSHEFRTPLALIITPLEKIIKYTDDPFEKKHFQLIHRNARRLLNLVNQLLDFRKLEVNELRLNPGKGNIVQYIRELSYSFTDIAENKKIHFSFQSNVEDLPTYFDHDKIERILFNLLSNAFKFTNEGGSVKVRLNVLPAQAGNRQLLEIKISDTGIGIEKEKQAKIFERFFQGEVPGSMVNQGSGIGLAITKEFVRLHEGAITLESEVNKGSSFTVTLPLAVNNEDVKEIATGTEAAMPQQIDLPENGLQPAGTAGTEAKKKKILLVEDNEDFRFYLKDNLRQFYHITEAPNGKAGWNKALAVHPDLIVCDINMPEMNGIDLCRKIKADSRTSFVPIILLTALTGEDQQLKGLETGANDYMTKPFNFEILLSKIRNLLEQQEKSKKTYQKQVPVQPNEIAIESVDDRFIHQAVEIVEKEMAEPDFSVEELSRKLFISRVALYKRLLSLTGKTPIEFIRSIRLKRAAMLLEKSQLTIAEIAYEVGFNNPKYFTKHFKEEFDSLPSIYRERFGSPHVKTLE